MGIVVIVEVDSCEVEAVGVFGGEERLVEGVVYGVEVMQEVGSWGASRETS
jgi:hypothetical protein